MRVSKFSIRQFRNIKEIEVLPNRIFNVLIGDNGQGKTSFIEALYYLSTLKSFRTGRTSDMIQKDELGFLIQGEVETPPQLSAHLKVRVEEKTRKLFINEKPIPASRFATHLRAVVFSPESLGSIKSGPEARRELIDQAVYQTSEHGGPAQREYYKVLRQRNACLRQVRNGDIPPPEGEDILESLESNFLDTASKIVEERLLFLDKIFPKIGVVLEKITGEKNSLKFSYKSGGQTFQSPWLERKKEDILERLRAELNSLERRRSERSAGVTFTGPHRHDITFLFNGNDSRIFCSQGQQRAVILAFKIAEIVYHSEAFGSYPLLLLDDVLSEFDERKRHFLIEFLRHNEAQTFLTTTDQTHFLKGSQVFQVETGKIYLRK